MHFFVCYGGAWRALPNDLPPWPTVHQQAQRGIKAGVFEAMARDLRMVLREVLQREGHPTAVILDGRTLQSTPESGHRAGYDGYTRKKGSKGHVGRGYFGTLVGP